MDGDPSGGAGAALERLASEFFRERSGPGQGPDPALPSAMRALQELQLHKVELEMQVEELRRAQEELELSRARYFDLYQSAPVGYCTLDEHLDILDANRAFLALLDETLDVVVGLPFLRFVAPDCHKAYHGHRSQVRALGQSQACELQLLRRDRSLCRVKLETTLSRNAAGRPVSLGILTRLTQGGADGAADPLFLERLRHIRLPAEGDRPQVLEGLLSRREVHILLRIGQGQTTREIASELALSPRTVDSHRQKIVQKLGIQPPQGLVKLAIAVWVREAARFSEMMI